MEPPKQDLQSFIETKRDFLEKFCQNLGWDFPPKMHETKLHKSGEDGTFPEIFDATPSRDTIHLDPEKLISVASEARKEARMVEIPTSAFEMWSTFNPSERLAIYEHAVRETQAAVPSMPLTEIDLVFERSDFKPNESQEKSSFEMQIEERNAKRRRINYKQAKKVHTSNKTHTEVMAEVINNQMEMYEEWLRESTARAAERQLEQKESDRCRSKEKERSDSSRHGDKHRSYSSKSRRERSRSRDSKKHKKEKKRKRSSSPQDHRRSRHSKKSKKHCH